jgi:drug/metabolite transporter (DMT)-like permease
MAGAGRAYALAVTEPGVRRGVPALLAAAFCIAFGTIAVKEAFLRGATSGALLTVRFAVAGALFATLLPFIVRRLPRPLPLPALGTCVLAGICLFAGARGEFEGLARLPATVLVVLLFVSPVWIALAEWVLWRRPLPGRRALAIAMVLAGALVLAGPGSGTVDAVGIAAGLGGSVGFSAFLILLERSQATLGALSAIAVAIMAAGLAGIAAEPGAFGSQLGDASIAPYGVAVGVAVWAWCVFAGFGLSLTDAVTTAVVSAMEPLFVALLALVFLDEALTARQLAGGAIVLAGVIVVSSARPGGVHPEAAQPLLTARPSPPPPAR